MLPRFESRAAALLSVTGASGSWAFPSSAVASVESFGEQPQGEQPLDLAALLGGASGSPDRDARVLVLQTGGKRERFWLRGALELLDGAAAQLLPLPPEIRAISPFISHVAVVGDKPALLVVSPERLFSR